MIFKRLVNRLKNFNRLRSNNMERNKTTKTSIPKWLGNYPFKQNEKKEVIVITREKELSTLYGYEGHQVCSEIFVSTDAFCFNEWTLPPGQCYAPPGLHPGDECYYVTEGDPTAFNPERGEVFQLHKGDTLLIPKGTRHQVCNFTNNLVKVIATNAPKTWVEDDGIGTNIPAVKNPKFYKRRKK
jgi:gentisate 1,2-dioxygenase